MPFKDRFKGPFKGPFKGRNRAASAEQLEVMQSYNSQETTIFFCEKPKFVARRRSERKQLPLHQRRRRRQGRRRRRRRRRRRCRRRHRDIHVDVESKIHF